jgi:hypothetical protein
MAMLEGWQLRDADEWRRTALLASMITSFFKKPLSPQKILDGLGPEHLKSSDKPKIYEDLKAEKEILKTIAKKAEEKRGRRKLKNQNRGGCESRPSWDKVVSSKP